MERYLYISYNADKSFKDCQSYQTLDGVKTERGITCTETTLALARVGSWTSLDGSGCYLIDFNSNQDIDFTDTGFANHIMRLIPATRRHLALNKLGI
jgi:hypothetical protein